MDTVVQHSYPSTIMLSQNRHPNLAMRARPQWVCWRYELIGGQCKKPPFHPLTGRKTDVTRPERWGTYHEALAAYSAGQYDGIGFVFLASDPYTGVDLDHCIDSQSGAITEWARKIIAALNSYTEYSPSGEGLHILTTATLPDRDRGLKEGNIEVYSSGVYFTWTNKHLPDSPETIEERQERVTLLHDWLLLKRSAREVKDYTWGGKNGSPGSPPAISWQSEEPPLSTTEFRARDQADAWILEKARAARNGATFAQLYETIVPDADGGQSIGDLQLCVQLLYWCRDATGRPDVNWADRLFRKSARMRAKWDRRLGAHTYGQVTLWKAYIDVERRFGHFWQQQKGGKG